jgi:hypothetical protein
LIQTKSENIHHNLTLDCPGGQLLVIFLGLFDELGFLVFFLNIEISPDIILELEIHDLSWANCSWPSEQGNDSGAWDLAGFD